jgi:site-specific DNA recombinase
MKAIIYTRVSDARQTDGTSLEQQEQYCRQWCERNSVDVVSVFEEAGQSAKTANRPKFQEMFTYLESHSDITHLVVDKWDRFSRSNEDAVMYRVQLRNLRVQLIAATQPASDDPQGRLMVNVLQSFAQFDNEVRAERSLRGMRQKALEGGFINPAPLGYKNNGKNKPSLVINEMVAELVRGLYERVASGDRLTDALEWARTRGLRGRQGARIAVQTASKLLRNPAYKGWLELPKMRISRQGDWEPIVDAGLWATVQNILNGNAAPRLVSHTRRNDAYVLRGVIVCDTCGKVVTASTSKNKSKKPHAYYHCMKGHMRIRVDRADGLFTEVLESLVPNPRRLRVVEECFREAWSQRNGTAHADRERLLTQLTTLQQRKRRLLSLVQDDALDSEEFKEANDSLKLEIIKVEAALADAEGASQELDCDTAFSYLEHLLYNQHLLWNESDAEARQRMAMQIFPSGIRCATEGFGTPVSHSIFSIMSNENVGAEDLVALPGIEPGF